MYCKIELNISYASHWLSQWLAAKWMISFLGLNYSVILINIEYIDGLWDHNLEIGQSSQLDSNGREFFFSICYTWVSVQKQFPRKKIKKRK
jgi:hypothetical protein